MSSTADLQRLMSVLRHEGKPGPVPFIELDLDPEIIAAVLGHPLATVDNRDPASYYRYADDRIAFAQVAGYAYVNIAVDSRLRRGTATAQDTAERSHQVRHWNNSTTGRITSWADFEAYPWPKPEEIDYRPMEYMLSRLPEEMGAFVEDSGGVLEWVMWLMSYDHFALAIYDQPDLVAAMFEKVTELMLVIARNMLDTGRFSAYFAGDDMGHVTGTMISPALMRRYVFPNEARLAALTHAHSLPYILHACGNLSRVMDDLIDTVKIDAKHSFEDKIELVEETHARYGRRIALLGGVDMDTLARGSEAEVRSRSRHLLDTLGPSGTWCLGTGNTVANYIPIVNYLAMLDEGRRWNRMHYGD